MSKRKKQTPQTTVKDIVHIKYVRRANMWVKTTVNGGKFQQQWSANNPG